ncbi:MAG: hypothetical protein FJX74_20340 [Armatimonadetes bacterium]|nr:hypothetical protein [Armatimonadota bacterium]
MLALPVAAFILGACLLLGAEVLALARLLRPEDDDLPLPERALFSLAAGMLVLALLILGLGLVGLFRPWALLAVTVASGLAGARRLPLLIEAVRHASRAVRRGLLGPSPRRALHLFLAAWGAMTLLGALAPPTDLDYDGLSQHLAAPNTYLRLGRIEPLWYDHHSHFPSTLQMLFGVCLATGQVEAAKVLHWSCGVLAALTMMVAGRRFLSPGAGAWGAFALLATPVVGWLASVAYVDLAGLLFAALTLTALLGTLRDAPDRAPAWDRGPGLLGLAAGGGAAVKMQGLQILGAATLVLVAAFVLARAPVARAARQLGLLLLVAAIPAAPWYVKTWVWTGNPVYPFAYEAFGGKYWGPGEAAGYRDHQLGFGVGEPPTAAERGRLGVMERTFSGPRAPLHLLLAPWNLAMRPAEFDVVNLSPLYALTSAAVGPLFLATLPLLLLGPRPRPVRWSLAALALLWIAWLALMQYNRYLVPALAFAAFPAGHVLAQGPPAGGLAHRLGRAVAWCCGGLALLFLAFHGLLTGSWAAGIGLTPHAAYLQARSECYRVGQWVNQVTPARGTRVALYSEPRGFYLDRAYLWADPGHSRLIEYDKLARPEDLLDAYSRLGITHVLYHRLPGAPALFDLAPYGTALAELERRGDVEVVGHPPRDPGYVLLEVTTPWARELTR